MADASPTAAGERADVLALFAKKRAAAAAIVRNSSAAPDDRDQASHWLRLLDVLAGEVAAGLHEGEAAVQAALGAGE